MRISDWSSDVCSSDLHVHVRCLERALDDAAEAGRAGRRHRGLARGRGLEKQVLADGVEARLVGEIGQLELADRSEEHTSELQSLMRISYAVFCLQKKKNAY